MEKTMCLRCGEMVRIDCVCGCRLNTSGLGVEHSERLAGQAPIGSETRQTIYEQLGQEVGKLTDHKQAAYGNSFGKAGQVMRILYPDGIQPDQYDDALAMVRVVDKLFRVATDKDAFGESPWRDIAGYGLLGSARCQN